MVGWIVAATLVLAVFVAWLAVGLLVGRLRPLRRAVRRLALQAEQAQAMQSKVEMMAVTLEALAEAGRAERDSRGMPAGHAAP